MHSRILKLLTRPTALALVVTASCAQQQPIETIRLDGSPGVAPLIQALVNSYRTSNGSSDVRIATGLGSSARLQAVADGTIDVAMASHGVVAADLERRGLRAHEVARTAVVFATHQSVPVVNLTRAQVCDVLAGRVASWTAFGLPDVPVVALMRPASEVDAEVASAGIHCLAGLTLHPRVQLIARPDEMAQALANTPGAIGVTSMTNVLLSEGRIRALSLDGVAPTADNVTSGRYGLTRQSLLVTRDPPSPAVGRLLRYIRSADGQRVIRANGAVPAVR